MSSKTVSPNNLSNRRAAASVNREKSFSVKIHLNVVQCFTQAQLSAVSNMPLRFHKTFTTSFLPYDNLLIALFYSRRVGQIFNPKHGSTK